MVTEAVELWRAQLWHLAFAEYLSQELNRMFQAMSDEEFEEWMARTAPMACAFDFSKSEADSLRWLDLTDACLGCR